MIGEVIELEDVARVLVAKDPSGPLKRVVRIRG
jgi:hypothetical protein